jgi:hypothetical protein
VVSDTNLIHELNLFTEVAIMSTRGRWKGVDS